MRPKNEIPNWTLFHKIVIVVIVVSRISLQIHFYFKLKLIWQVWQRIRFWVLDFDTIDSCAIICISMKFMEQWSLQKPNSKGLEIPANKSKLFKYKWHNHTFEVSDSSLDFLFNHCNTHLYVFHSYKYNLQCKYVAFSSSCGFYGPFSLYRFSYGYIYSYKWINKQLKERKGDMCSCA